ncbi:chromate transporter-domain-containing protein [Microdochium trichocladiopsis]|uniref:Chromate transporter-domain-containing protein n=1 Tax=Microdochium trichocladiopsis TaxID=1682393 RepID=A0A9P9BI36_9PEZI|nr:chromate transporter-domain-containing protein [Microdochium trichocladiopsis]KAH7012667.1 chromate transporter-domain-containing protein [Microdochium trichocladiopsis]
MAIQRRFGWHPAEVQDRLWNTLRENWYLGFTSFGGPPTHFKIVDEQMYQELFSVCQAFSGPGSTKMHYCINLLHDGTLSALFGFLLWSLPGALGMFGLSIGVSNIGETLPRPAYAVLSGLNAATVGIVALAAVQLSEKAITDKLTRIIVFLGASAGMLYNALWYFPLLMLLAGITSVVFDFRWLHGPVKAVVGVFKPKEKRRQTPPEEEAVDMSHQQEAASQTASVDPIPSRPTSRAKTGDTNDAKAASRGTLPQNAASTAGQLPPSPLTQAEEQDDELRVVPQDRQFNMSWKTGVAIIAAFLASFAAVMILRGTLPAKSLLFSLFANMYLAGTIIFGGGPVVIPLLREYTVTEGWLSTRDFLLGLAITQAFPGPNFNFAVYLGSLTAINAGYPAAAGAVLGFVGMFAPGLITVHGTMGVWHAIRGWRWVKSSLRGINAAAVGLIYTAVYRLWQTGYIDESYQQGTNLGLDPWWVVVMAGSYFGGYWFGVSPPVAILAGAVMGLVWYGVVST